MSRLRHQISLNFRSITLVMAAALVMAISSCVSPPEYPLEPVLTFESITSTTIVEGSQDTIFLRFAFTDGDGDLGHGDPQAPEPDTTRNVFLSDSRVPAFPIFYHIDEVAQSDNVQAISGFVDLRFNPGFFACLSLEEPQDTLSLSLYVIDRAGNRSNSIRTPLLTLVCQ